MFVCPCMCDKIECRVGEITEIVIADYSMRFQTFAVMQMRSSFLWDVILHYWLMGEMSVDILTLEDVTTLLSQNTRHELPSHIVTHRRRKQTSADHIVTVKAVGQCSALQMVMLVMHLEGVGEMTRNVNSLLYTRKTVMWIRLLTLPHSFF